MVVLKIRYLRDISPVGYSRDGDCAIDLRASGAWITNLDGDRVEVFQDEIVLGVGERVVVESGVAVEIPNGFWGSIRDRSGMACNHGLHILGGVIDENFRGEIGVIIVNLSIKPQTLRRNERVAQLIILPYSRAVIEKVDFLSGTSRGDGRLGSSGRV